MISIHAAREGGDISATLKGNSFNISIHAAREGGDCYNRFNIVVIGKYFNPRRP